ncbi:MAG: tRNA preQ1(34) S-adenosylmethionine ribosyltransferase-isomerase QueA [Candidatus Margulisbacteria bacterium]|nr:tRNA preQ1(34) S-adenosylmethionine ribosyltransferase-isomerase QueA [Candidatus Margulisiibacteriota bacterium]MBU1617238.1 tRNA preQ1(34) S-adenosylmethionine ribosyltransferase-isomerase QueA [Candidatus Margulisiibacteriota bacterium]MBU1867276.1 tRNA preQ1(34) S-adenosylmethionine ribosyltransferase-isomerase QueA [Candidatus Margulisiibacteriota bacterium]
MRTAKFDYNLPEELIAQAPSADRDHSRLMVLDRAGQTIGHKHFYDIADYFQPGDLLVLNNTKVIPANLTGCKIDGGAKVEVLLSKQMQNTDPDKKIFECLVKPGKKLKVGDWIVFNEGEVSGVVIEKTTSGEQIIDFRGDLWGYMKKEGELPLPPYVKTNRHSPELQGRYQTVFAEKEGAAAAPTAGLHFTPELLAKIEARGVKIAYVTLHTGLATFKPIYAENIEDHHMYSEAFEVPAETIALLGEAKRVVAVGTTAIRTLETIADHVKAGSREGVKGETALFIYPGYQFKLVDAIITNFHFPRTSLIVLVAAFAGLDLTLEAYKTAVREKYRFYSFGDAMLIL